MVRRLGRNHARTSRAGALATPAGKHSTRLVAASRTSIARAALMAHVAGRYSFPAQFPATALRCWARALVRSFFKRRLIFFRRLTVDLCAPMLRAPFWLFWPGRIEIQTGVNLWPRRRKVKTPTVSTRPLAPNTRRCSSRCDLIYCLVKLGDRRWDASDSLNGRALSTAAPSPDPQAGAPLRVKQSQPNA
jgi:hypothetical protein